MTEQVQANDLVTSYENTYNFRQDKSGFKRASLSLNFPVPSLAGISEAALNGSDKVKSYIHEVVAGQIVSHIKGLVDNDLEFSQEKLDEILAKTPIDLEYLATLPRSERSGASKEDIDNFAATYKTIMATVLEIPQEKVDLAADIFQQRLKPILAKPKMLAKMRDYLGKFVEAVSSDAEVMEQNSKAVTWFEAKFQELLAANLDEDAI